MYLSIEPSLTGTSLQRPSFCPGAQIIHTMYIDSCLTLSITVTFFEFCKVAVVVPCEQWFLQTGRYASMGKKPLRVTVCFSIEHALPRDDYEYPTRSRQRELQQNNSLISKTTTLHVHHAFIFAFLCHFCTTTT